MHNFLTETRKKVGNINFRLAESRRKLKWIARTKLKRIFNCTSSTETTKNQPHYALNFLKIYKYIYFEEKIRKYGRYKL